MPDYEFGQVLIIDFLFLIISVLDFPGRERFSAPPSATFCSEAHVSERRAGTTLLNLGPEGQSLKIFLDTANLDELKKGASWGIVDGVTTNPTLIAKEGRPIAEQVRLICDIVDGDISPEVVSTEASAMIKEGKELAKIHKNIVVK